MPLSILIGTKDRPQFLRDCLQAVALQTRKNFEVVVINDGGARVEGVVKDFSFPIRILNLPNNLGTPAALNRGLVAARGKYIALCDDDDLFAPKHLELLTLALERMGGRGLVYSDVSAFRGGPENIVGTLRRDFDCCFLRETNFIVPSSFLFSRSLIQEVGDFDATLTCYHDWDFFLKVAKVAPIQRVPEVLTLYRLHDRSIQVTAPEKIRRQQLDALCQRYRLGSLPLKILFDHFEEV